MKSEIEIRERIKILLADGKSTALDFAIAELDWVLNYNVGERLLPCPFCGCDSKLFGPDENEMWAVVCQQPEDLCNVRLLYCHSKQEALHQWNMRANVV